MSSSLVPVPVPGTDVRLSAARLDGRTVVALKPLCEALGVDHSAQLKRLKGRSWAVVAMTATTAADGKTYQTTVIDEATIPLWLATLDERRVAPTVRGTLVALQREAANALHAYFTEGAAINPRATTDQLAGVIERARAQAGVLQALKGLIDPKHLELKARLLAARALGEEPDIDALDRPLLVQDYLASKGLNRTLVEAKQSGFGKRLRGAFLAEYGREPGKRLQDFGCGTIREVNAYTERHRHLFDAVWNRHYATKVADSALFAIDGGAS